MTPVAARGAIGIRNVSKIYDPDGANVLAVDDCSVEIAPGEFCVIVGPSGCGKTTLLNIISGLVRPTRGRILFDDRDVTDLPTEARNIAQVFQFPVVYDTMTVFDLRLHILSAGAEFDLVTRRPERCARSKPRKREETSARTVSPSPR